MQRNSNFKCSGVLNCLIWSCTNIHIRGSIPNNGPEARVLKALKKRSFRRPQCGGSLKGRYYSVRALKNQHTSVQLQKNSHCLKIVYLTTHRY